MSGPLDYKLGRRQFLTLAAGSAVGLVAPQHAYANAAAENYVKKIAGDVMNLANSGGAGKSLRNQFASLLNRYINLRGIANFALGPYQKKLPAGDRELFYDLVSNYSAALFVYYVADFRGSSLEITSSEKEGKFITIKSAIKLKSGGSESVRWRLVPQGSGFKVSDVNLKGIWLTISMKQRFKDVLGRSGGDFKVLYDELREAETW